MNYINDLISFNPELANIKPEIEKFVEILYEAAISRNTIFTCGNGGSASDSEHIAGELLKSFIIKRGPDNDFAKKLASFFGDEGVKLASGLEEGIKAIPIVSISSFLSAYSNDRDWNMAYAQFVYVMGESKDVLIGISASGNALNVNNALMVAVAKGMKRILLTGNGNGICVKNADIVIRAPAAATFRTQEYHTKIYHAVCAEVEEIIFRR